LTWSSKAAGRWGARTVGVGLAVLAPCALRAQSSPPTIDTIIVVNRNIFDVQDGDAPGFLARVVNHLHARTRASVIRGTLFVNPGDPYDSARVAESERALRALSVFSRVRIDTTRLDHRLAVRVATTDGWSTKPQLGYSSAGGDATWLLGLVEENLFGTATSFTAVYNRTPDRSVVNLRYWSPHFLGRRTRLGVEYNAKSDGKAGFWQLGVPFYETVADRTLSTDGEAASERVLRFRNGTLFDSLARRALRFSAVAGFAPHATTQDYRRLWLAAQWRREDFAPESASVIPRSVFGTVGLGLDLAHVRFQVLEHFNSYARREDVNASQLFHVGVWAAPRAWGYPSDQAGVGTDVSGRVSALWPGGFAVLRAGGQGVFTAGAPDSGRVSSSLTVASQNLSGQTLIFHLEGAALRRPKPGTEFDLWASRNGPRIFGVHEFTGTRMVWLAFEDRIVVADEVWGLLAVGVAPFLDYGGAWYAGDPQRLGGDLGVALRLGPTRAVRGDVGEFGVGYRFGTGFSGSRWGFTIRKAVSF
jgi:hypothetical protein